MVVFIEFSEQKTSVGISYIDVKCKLYLLVQAVGYNSVEAEDWEIATRGEDIGKLETLLLDKNRKMEHELTQVKVRLLTANSLDMSTSLDISWLVTCLICWVLGLALLSLLFPSHLESCYGIGTIVREDRGSISC